VNKTLRLLYPLMLFAFPFISIGAAKSLSIRYPSSFYVEVKCAKDPAEAQDFAGALIYKLGIDESSEQYSKPGFPVVLGGEDGDYLLKVELVEQTVDTIPGESNIVDKAFLYDRDFGNDQRIWSKEFVCMGITLKAATQECVDLISDELKSAQVKKGKRAGKMGWAKKSK
jgi:hypothetical protein